MNNHTMRNLITIFIMFDFVITSCSVGGTGNPGDSYAETVFEASIRNPLQEGETLYLEMLDEVTGIALNPTRFEMEAKDDYSYFIRIPLATGTLVKYRFLKTGSENSIEYNSIGTSVHYRVYEVTSAAVVPNFIAGWNGDEFAVGTGEVSGFIFDADTEAPAPEVMVNLNGLSVLTAHDGFFKFENVPSGEYFLTAYRPTGQYRPFQQKAVVADNAVTPASFGMTPADFVDIRFIVNPPEGTIANSPIRILGDLYQLGNTFNELKGGGSVLPSRAPVLEMRDDGKYELTLSLPAGTPISYKYSLGDGFINSEHYADGRFHLRKILVPDRNTIIQDEIESWHSNDKRTMTIHVNSPQEMPGMDVMSIQMNPFTWMEPFPIWDQGDDQWEFRLYSPMEYLDGAQYRFCRNEQCGIADDSVTAGVNPVGYAIDFGDLSKMTIQYDLQKWVGLDRIAYEIQPGNPADYSHLTNNGFEFSFPYNSHWNNYQQIGMIDAGVSGAKWIIFSPSWTFENKYFHTAELIPGEDPFAQDIDNIYRSVEEAGLLFALFPQPKLLPSDVDYWAEAQLTYNWWQEWFKDYERFILNYADFAEVSGIQYLIIGGDFVAPAIPGGSLSNGASSNLPADIAEKWTALIGNIRTRYHGKLGFALPYSVRADATADLLAQVDEIYVEISTPLSANSSPAVDEIEERMGKILDEEIYNLYATHGKPVAIGINYYSVDGSASDCIQSGQPCSVLINNQSNSNLSLDMVEQADIYQGVLRAAAQRPWLSGVISQGFNPAVAVQDASSSVLGKPAMDVLTYYYRQVP